MTRIYRNLLVMLTPIVLVSTGCAGNKKDIVVTVRDAVSRTPIQKASLDLRMFDHGGWFSKTFIGTMESSQMIAHAETDERGEAKLHSNRGFQDCMIEAEAKGYAGKNVPLPDLKIDRVNIMLDH